MRCILFLTRGLAYSRLSLIVLPSISSESVRKCFS